MWQCSKGLRGYNLPDKMQVPGLGYEGTVIFIHIHPKSSLAGLLSIPSFAFLSSLNFSFWEGFCSPRISRITWNTFVSVRQLSKKVSLSWSWERRFWEAWLIENNTETGKNLGCWARLPPLDHSLIHQCLRTGARLQFLHPLGNISNGSYPNIWKWGVRRSILCRGDFGACGITALILGTAKNSVWEERFQKLTSTDRGREFLD